jgi:antitoxin VapB
MTYVAKVFQDGRSQAIRIPKEYRFDTAEVYIEKSGDALIVRPKQENRWDRWFAMSAGMDAADFLAERSQLPLGVKEIF